VEKKISEKKAINFILPLAEFKLQGKMPFVSLIIGVLDIQGSVEEHLAALRKIGAEAVPVKNKKDLEKVSGLIIPGGESTTIGKLMRRYGLDKAIRQRANLHSLTLWGTCAGAILLASLKLMDMEIERNAYGRQVDSFETEISVRGLGRGGHRKIPAPFIRAPKVKRASLKVKVLAQYNGSPVMLRQENLLATMFHPELTDDLRIHKYFVTMTKEYANNKSKY
jgi:5'-phosphate synthase pdxT subunit